MRHGKNNRSNQMYHLLYKTAYKLFVLKNRKYGTDEDSPIFYLREELFHCNDKQAFWVVVDKFWVK